MKRFVVGVDREQNTLFPDRLEDWIGDDNPVRVVMFLLTSSILAAWVSTG
jgi:transposase